jgi:excisionase family DNA binding protein
MMTAVSHISTPPLLLLTDAAQMLRCSVKTVRRLISDGKLRSVKLRGALRIKASDLEAFIETSTR